MQQQNFLSLDFRTSYRLAQTALLTLSSPLSTPVSSDPAPWAHFLFCLIAPPFSSKGEHIPLLCMSATHPFKHCQFLKPSLMAQLGVISLCSECLYHTCCHSCWKCKILKGKDCVSHLCILAPGTHPQTHLLNVCWWMNGWTNEFVWKYVFHLYDSVSNQGFSTLALFIF